MPHMPVELKAPRPGESVSEGGVQWLKPDGAAVRAPPPAPAAAPAAGPRETRQKMTPLRQTIAKRLLSAQQSAAILTTFNEADMTAILALRARYKDAFQKKHGVGLGFMSFFVR